MFCDRCWGGSWPWDDGYWCCYGGLGGGYAGLGSSGNSVLLRIVLFSRMLYSELHALVVGFVPAVLFISFEGLI